MALEKNWTEIFLFITNRDGWLNITLQRLPLLLKHFNPFKAPNALILYPLKTPENFWFSNVFRGYKMGTLVRNYSICVRFSFNIPIDTYICWKIESLG